MTKKSQTTEQIAAKQLREDAKTLRAMRREARQLAKLTTQARRRAEQTRKMAEKLAISADNGKAFGNEPEQMELNRLAWATHAAATTATQHAKRIFDLMKESEKIDLTQSPDNHIMQRTMLDDGTWGPKVEQAWNNVLTTLAQGIAIVEEWAEEDAWFAQQRANDTLDFSPEGSAFGTELSKMRFVIAPDPRREGSIFEPTQEDTDSE